MKGLLLPAFAGSSRQTCGELSRVGTMGEPKPETHSRIYEFDGWPVDSSEELADYADWLIDLVRQASTSDPEVKLTIRILGRGPFEGEKVLVEELRERIDEFPLDKFTSATLEVREGDALALTLKLDEQWLGMGGASVAVNGTDKARVQSIKDRVKEEGDARIEAARKKVAEAAAKQKADEDFKRQQEAAGIGPPPEVTRAIFEAERKREQERNRRPPPKPRKRPAPSPAPTPEPSSPKQESRLRRFFYNPWTVAIGSGLILLAAAIIWQA